VTIPTTNYKRNECVVMLFDTVMPCLGLLSKNLGANVTRETLVLSWLFFWLTLYTQDAYYSIGLLGTRTIWTVSIPQSCSIPVQRNSKANEKEKPARVYFSKAHDASNACLACLFCVLKALPNQACVSSRILPRSCTSMPWIENDTRN